MKNSCCRSFVTAGVLTLVLLFTLQSPLATLAQGSLTPPGPPAATMKTLAQIQPRTLISSAPYFISEPGSYYLTTNLTGVANNDGIVILCDNVTLDLNGFALIGVGNAFQGIGIFGVKNICVRNGIVRGWPQGGIGGLNNERFERLLITDNGAAGISAFDNCVVIDCTATDNGSVGIGLRNGSTAKDCVASFSTGSGFVTGSGCTISGCVAMSNTSAGITLGPGSLVKDSTALSNGGGGIVLGIGSLANSCNVRGNAGDGIAAADGGTVAGCVASGNTGTGIVLGSVCLAINNNCYSNSIWGLRANGGGSRIEGNNVTGLSGISAITNCLVIRNSWHTSDFGAIGSGTLYGTVESVSATMNANKNPHANFYLAP